MKSAQNQVLRSVAKIFDARIANRLADILADELIPADVVEAPPLGFEVWVRDEHFSRARGILDATPLTEERLTYLATGVLGEGPRHGVKVSGEYNNRFRANREVASSVSQGGSR